jgi:hypothetical protein
MPCFSAPADASHRTVQQGAVGQTKALVHTPSIDADGATLEVLATLALALGYTGLQQKIQDWHT